MQISIYNKNAQLIAAVELDDASYRYRALMTIPKLYLKFTLGEYLNFDTGCYCVYMQKKFTSQIPATIKKQSNYNYEYTLEMEGEEAVLSLYKFTNYIDHRIKWSMCAQPQEFLQYICECINAHLQDPREYWSVGSCLSSTEKTVEFNHVYLLDALKSIADTFETEWEVNNGVISLHKVEYNKTTPLPLSYGKGNGFVPGVGRATQSEDAVIARLYPQGGERNIDASTYGSRYLLLPISQRLGFDGEKFHYETGFDSSNARYYVSDANGLYIRNEVQTDAEKEDSLDCDEIYPSRVGSVTSVIVVNASKNFYDIIDNTIPANLDFNNYIIAGETPTIIFQTGMLAGREFEFQYKHAQRRFELVPAELDGQTMPNATFIPQIGNQYAIFGIALPQEYICDNATHEGASWDMFRESVRYMFDHEQVKFTFTGDLQGLWARNHWNDSINVGGRLVVGGYVDFTDTHIAPNGALIRITGIKDFLNKPYAPTLELSNSVSTGTISSSLRKIDQQEISLVDVQNDLLNYTKRRFRDASETIEMIEQAMLAGYTGGVSPITVQTMAALVGDESLQFQFVNNLQSRTIINPFTYNATDKQLEWDDCYIQHYTLGITMLKNSHSVSEYKWWYIDAGASAVLSDADARYYVYAKVPITSGDEGEIILDTQTHSLTEDANFYYLWVGVLNSENEDTRSFATLYGFTEILPGRITTDKILSADGQTYFDLANSEIGGRINFKDGLVSGLVGVGNANGINAGLNGSGNSDDSVRFWAGASESDIPNAPFRVLNNGDAVMRGYLLRGRYDITADNYTDLPTTGTNRLLDVLSLGAYIYINANVPTLALQLPVLLASNYILNVSVNTLNTPKVLGATRIANYSIEKFRQLMGQKVLIYNFSGNSIVIRNGATSKILQDEECVCCTLTRSIGRKYYGTADPQTLYVYVEEFDWEMDTINGCFVSDDYL